ncbi:hypothetical protein M011DRAFT_474360 [Sporormia fimetaria CBS 119925]|uniref:Uncharacterized protein n=1 Tax=Sporormia fimetaria CBS 119925 TaxID=1340428 RepID=A0A6A6VJS5_9PLEO|nr:hypothetical protein M011DRAFT_474360 [Sporormia fimetaria CBS 119925]
MSDKASTGGATTDSNGTAGATVGPNFTEREQEILKFAWSCLKSGPPEIDYQKLASLLGMSNPRSASNAWAKIKPRLMHGVPEGEDGAVAATLKKGRKPKAKADAANGDDDSGDGPATPKKRSPKKKAAPKVKTEGDDDGEGDEDMPDAPATPAKSPRKRAPKKQDVDGEESPKKRGRPAKAKKDDEEKLEEKTEQMKVDDKDDEEQNRTDEKTAANGDEAADEV